MVTCHLNCMHFLELSCHFFKFPVILSIMQGCHILFKPHSQKTNLELYRLHYLTYSDPCCSYKRQVSWAKIADLEIQNMANKWWVLRRITLGVDKNTAGVVDCRKCKNCHTAGCQTMLKATLIFVFGNILTKMLSSISITPWCGAMLSPVA